MKLILNIFLLVALLKHSHQTPVDYSEYDYYDLGTKIVNGKNAGKHEFPSIVALLDDDGKLFCGGTLVDKKFVATAAHCYRGIDESTEVLAGAHDVSKNEDTQQRFRVKKLIVHPDYTGNNRTVKNGKPLPRELNDIALLELSEEIVENEFVKIARLPDKNVNKEDGKSAKIAGWGTTTGEVSNILLKEDVNIIDVDTCIAKDTYKKRVPYKASILCAASDEGTDSCQSDSGGPLYCSTGSGDDDSDGDYIDVSFGIKTSGSGNNVLCGITSLSVGPCGFNGKFKPIYTNVINYVEWIQEHIYKKECRTSVDDIIYPDKPCIFPFKYAGKTYTKCTDIGRHENICAVEVDGDRNLKDFAECSEDCSK